MGLINWIFDIYQHQKISEAREEAASARAEAARVVRSSDPGASARIEGAVGELALATKTLQRLLVDKGVCTADELQRMLVTVDREDGREDGRAPI